jgi:hypothetical protein
MTRRADTRSMRRYLLALLALTLLSGCGGAADSSLFATAIRNTEAAGGAEVVFSMRMEGAGLAQPLVMNGSGVEDAGTGRGHLNFDMASFGTMEVVSDDLTMYIRSDLLGAALGGKKWMKLDMKRAMSSFGLDLGASGQFGQSAAEQLKMLRAVSGDVRDEGHEQVAGTDTTHYSATVDLRRYPDVMPEEQREAARMGVERLIELTGQSEIPMDVWIDGDERVRRMAWSQSIRQGPVEMKMDITAEYVRFGVPVDVDVPDDSEVFDATDLVLQQMEQVQP